MELLCEERVALNVLLYILQDEEILLREGRADELPELAEKKTAILVRLDELACLRHQTLAAEGFAPDERGMRGWLDRHPSPSIEQVWAEVLSTIPIARERNRLNGILIAKRLSRNQEALRLLTGKRDPGMIYGSDGQPKVSPAMGGFVTS